MANLTNSGQYCQTLDWLIELVYFVTILCLCFYFILFLDVTDKHLNDFIVSNTSCRHNRNPETFCCLLLVVQTSLTSVGLIQDNKNVLYIRYLLKLATPTVTWCSKVCTSIWPAKLPAATASSCPVFVLDRWTYCTFKDNSSWSKSTSCFSQFWSFYSLRLGNSVTLIKPDNHIVIRPLS